MSPNKAAGHSRDGRRISRKHSVSRIVENDKERHERKGPNLKLSKIGAQSVADLKSLLLYGVYGIV